MPFLIDLLTLLAGVNMKLVYWFSLSSCILFAFLLSTSSSVAEHLFYGELLFQAVQ